MLTLIDFRSRFLGVFYGTDALLDVEPSVLLSIGFGVFFGDLRL
jgi:hypothetical protein